MPHPNANGRVLIVWLIKLIKAATNVRRGLPEWSTETITLPPGTYSADVTGSGGTTGIALVEVYEVP